MGSSTRKLVVTGSSGLIGSEAVTYFDARGWEVLGIDNNMRMDFFGPPGDTRWNLKRLKDATKNFRDFDLDIRNRQSIFAFFKECKPDAVIHCAAQPSHDLAKERPVDDFEVNALGTSNMLEASRLFAKESPFVYMSTNKVYGDAPNEIPLVEKDKRYDYKRKEDYQGVGESCRIDQCLHSLFGASKAAADLLTQEYGRYFGMPTVCFRGGCLTGPNHSGVELHGFLSYIIKVAVRGGAYSIYGYKGKQVRDQIYSQDVIRAMEAFIEAPRPGEVYNIGGGRENNASVLECIEMIEQRLGRKMETTYVDTNRIGDHICYISDLTKLKKHYPKWGLTRTLPQIVDEILEAEQARAKNGK